jgi:hypothetical protein
VEVGILEQVDESRSGGHHTQLAEDPRGASAHPGTIGVKSPEQGRGGVRPDGDESGLCLLLFAGDGAAELPDQSVESGLGLFAVAVSGWNEGEEDGDGEERGDSAGTWRASLDTSRLWHRMAYRRLGAEGSGPWPGQEWLAGCFGWLGSQRAGAGERIGWPRFLPVKSLCGRT